MSKRLTTEQFIQAARKVHGDKFQYKKARYVNSHANVEIICPLHGSFFQTPNGHLSGAGCSACSGVRRPTSKEFVQRLRKIWGKRYDLSRVVYKAMSRKIIVICKDHGAWSPLANNFLRGMGCYLCGRKSVGKALRHAPNDIKKRIETAHPNIRVIGTPNGTGKKVLLLCTKCGYDWLAVPTNASFADGRPKRGCPKCKISSGERLIINFLHDRRIPFEYEPRLILDNKNMSFDFLLRETSTLIEFNGGQHYRPIRFYGGERAFASQQKRDRFKKNWARRNGYRLIVIPYTVKDIPAFLSKHLSLGLKKAA